MKLLLAVVLVGATSALVERTEWEAYKEKYNKVYANPIEELHRMKVYANNKALVSRHMKEYAEGKHTFTMAINQFADLTNEEFSARHGGLKVGSTVPHTAHKMSGKTAPASVDWRDHGAVTPIPNQGACGSSWAFAATGSLEGAWKLSGHELVELSVQQLLDCTGRYGCYGCQGGWMDKAFEYIRDNGGIQSVSSYPYTAKNGDCHSDASKNVATLSNWTDVPQGSEAGLLDGVANHGPVSVGIDATRSSFQMYSGGVYDDPHCHDSQVGHGALVVGYGTEDGKDYWLVKNWWGASWGLDGYIKMSRNKNNQCGIAAVASYAVV
ncbi:procathepsin L-like [Pollicipes pollicipes]|uniref:procathepsin L-like n=1 Tax=Pollicipes pollicipes TaxID=41117 RepID=UPI0018858D78|nr:procathepsin L-like [Pollicipes pollicipes]